MVQNRQKYRMKYWVTRSSFCSFTRTAHSFACTALLASHARSAALTLSPTCSLRSLPCSWDSEWLDGYFFCVFFLFLTILVWCYHHEDVIIILVTKGDKMKRVGEKERGKFVSDFLHNNKWKVPYLHLIGVTNVQTWVNISITVNEKNHIYIQSELQTELM